MSTILKALRRLEREGGARSARPLRGDVAVELEADGQGGRRLVQGGALALGLALAAALVWGFWDWEVSEPRPSPLAPAAPVLAKPALDALPRVQEVPPPPAPEAPASPSPPAAFPEPTPPAPPAPLVAPEPTPPAPPPRASTFEPIPVPAFVVIRTVWHPDAARRVAVVEMDDREQVLRLHEGDALGPLVVRAIEPSGVVFRQGEIEVRRRLGRAR